MKIGENFSQCGWSTRTDGAPALPASADALSTQPIFQHLSTAQKKSPSQCESTQPHSGLSRFQKLHNTRCNAGHPSALRSSADALRELRRKFKRLNKETFVGVDEPTRTKTQCGHTGPAEGPKLHSLTVFLFLAFYGCVFTVKPGQGTLENNPKTTPTHSTTMPPDWAQSLAIKEGVHSH